MSAPSFNLPRTVTNLQQAKKFIAEHFGVFPQMVFKIGESYHSHVGVTPQRIHPFGVAVPPDFFSDRKMETMPLYQVMLIRQKIADMNVNLDYRLVAARAYKMLGQDAALDARLRAKPILAQRLGQVNTEWSMPVSYHQSPVIETQKSAPAAPVQAQKPQPFHAAIMTAPPQQQPETPVTVTPLRAPVVPPKEIASEPAPVAQTVEPIEEFEQELDEFLEEQVQHEGLRHDPR